MAKRAAAAEAKAEDGISNPEKTGGRHAPFAPGNPGGPGRPKGSRNKLGEAFVEALHADFEKHGVATIQKVREEKPEQYVKVIASLLPKELKIEATSDLTDEQLDQRIRALAAAIGLEVGVGEPPVRAPTATGSRTAH